MKYRLHGCYLPGRNEAFVPLLPPRVCDCSSTPGPGRFRSVPVTPSIAHKSPSRPPASDAFATSGVIDCDPSFELESGTPGTSAETDVNGGSPLALFGVASMLAASGDPARRAPRAFDALCSMSRR